MTKEEFLQSTIDYYSVDPKNKRCKNSNSNLCFYSPKFSLNETEGCAIGRKLDKEFA